MCYIRSSTILCSSDCLNKHYVGRVHKVQNALYIRSDHRLDQQLLDLQLNVVDLASKLAVGVAHDGASNNGTSNSASTTQSNLRGNKDVGDILVLAKERNVENDLKRLSIGSHHDEGALTTIQSLRSYNHNHLSVPTFIGSLLQLAVVSGLLDQIQNRGSQFGGGKGIGLRTIVILEDEIHSQRFLRSFSERCVASAI